tara:strand:+ start:3581 stop:4000 length:420 start_codon:yes stop_codon:yes gene_type:complete
MVYQVNGITVMHDGYEKLVNNNAGFKTFGGYTIVKNSSQSNISDSYGYALSQNAVGTYSVALSNSYYTYWSPIVGGNTESGSNLRTSRYSNGLAQPFNAFSTSGVNGFSNTGYSGTWRHMCTRSAYYGRYAQALYIRIS